MPPSGIDPTFEPAVICALLEEIYVDQLARAARIRRRDAVMVAMYEKSASKSEIGRLFGISPCRVGRILEQHGVTAIAI